MREAQSLGAQIALTKIAIEQIEVDRQHGAKSCDVGQIAHA